MSRRIPQDFCDFQSFLAGYNLSSYCSDSKQVDSCKTMHRKLLGLLIFDAEFELQRVHQSASVFLKEMASDLLLSLFCVVQGMYKPARMQIRCSIENFIKALVLINNQAIIQEKSMYAVFDAAKADSHFSTAYSTRCLNSLHSDYTILCGTVHSAPSAMQPTSALAVLPRYDEELQNEVSSIFIRTAESFLGLLYLNYPAVVEKMHPENRQDYLECMTKNTKGMVVSTLFSD